MLNSWRCVALRDNASYAFSQFLVAEPVEAQFSIPILPQLLQTLKPSEQIAIAQILPRLHS
jgi:hypothetical protein